MNKIKAGIVGASGYAGGELLRLLLLHNGVELKMAYSRSKAGIAVADLFRDLSGDTGLFFTNTPEENLDVVFLCLGHGEAVKWLEQNPLSPDCMLIDLSMDLRMAGQETGFVYGLPERNRDLVRQSKKIANPGCFATAIQLALLPMSENGLLRTEVHVQAMTGSTGAGQSLSETGHFSWRHANASVYKAFQHQHLSEIQQGLSGKGTWPGMQFVPMRGPFTRGIIANAITRTDMSAEQLNELYRAYYNTHPFVHVCDGDIDLKMVLNTNKCLLQLQVSEGNVLITSVVDNLLKGASGQAVQNMNLMAGFDETEGLKLKASVY